MPETVNLKERKHKRALLCSKDKKNCMLGRKDEIMWKLERSGPYPIAAIIIYATDEIAQAAGVSVQKSLKSSLTEG